MLNRIPKSMQSKNKISEFDAAVKYKISPFLLRKFTSYSPKKDGKKLKFTEENDIYYFEESELIDFDLYLHRPWPHKENEKPTIPDYIKAEIKKEAEYRCPICRTTAGELAHINPVSKTFNNHPHNLIYLCPTHHTAYDFGHKYANVDKEEVLIHKKALQTFQATLWGLQRKSVESYFFLINKIGRVIDLEEQFLKLNLKVNFDSTYDEITSKVESVEKSVENTSLFKEFVRKSRESKSSNDFLELKIELESKFNEGAERVNCALCNGKGWTDHFETCPPCGGEGKIAEEQLSNIDFSIYDLVNCKLCKGKGWTDHFETCPPCGGEGKITEEQISNIDFSIYDFVDCKLCDGKGWTDHFEICPPCGGEGKITEEQLSNIDFSVYDLVDCKLCDGKGYTNHFETCPPCGGEGKITEDQLRNIDFSVYDLVDCKLCDGKGYTNHFETCPPCSGGGKLTEEQISNIDFSIYDLVNCKLCDGRGWSDRFETCPPCGGEGKLTEEQISNLDFSIYK